MGGGFCSSGDTGGGNLSLSASNLILFVLLLCSLASSLLPGGRLSVKFQVESAELPRHFSVPMATDTPIKIKY